METESGKLGKRVLARIGIQLGSKYVLFLVKKATQLKKLLESILEALLLMDHCGLVLAIKSSSMRVCYAIC